MRQPCKPMKLIETHAVLTKATGILGPSSSQVVSQIRPMRTREPTLRSLQQLQQMACQMSRMQLHLLQLIAKCLQQVMTPMWSCSTLRATHQKVQPASTAQPLPQATRSLVHSAVLRQLQKAKQTKLTSCDSKAMQRLVPVTLMRPCGAGDRRCTSIPLMHTQQCVHGAAQAGQAGIGT
jgi:hypothetical protein